MNSEPSIERCALAYQCTQQWSALERLPATENVRFCLKCQSSVYLAADDAELEEHARQGRCVAIVRPQRGDCWVGMA